MCPVIGFHNENNSIDYLVRAALLKLNEIKRCEPCGNKSYLVCGSISTAMTFSTEAPQETFEFRSGPLN